MQQPHTRYPDERLRSRLEQERERLTALKRARELEALQESQPGSFQELSSLDQHPADLGTETFEREKAQAIRISVQERLSDIEHALAKLENGSYGACEICRNPIPQSRLEARPETRYCAQDAGRLATQGGGQS